MGEKKERENTGGKESLKDQGRCWTETTRATKVADNERQMEGEKNEEMEQGRERGVMRDRWTCAMDGEVGG